MFYRNTSDVKKTFHGITFKPGEVKDSPGYINDPKFERVESMPKEPPKSVEVKNEPSTTTKKIENKEETVNGSDSNQ